MDVGWSLLSALTPTRPHVLYLRGVWRGLRVDAMRGGRDARASVLAAASPLGCSRPCSRREVSRSEFGISDVELDCEGRVG